MEKKYLLESKIDNNVNYFHRLMKNVFEKLSETDSENKPLWEFIKNKMHYKLSHFEDDSLKPEEFKALTILDKLTTNKKFINDIMSMMESNDMVVEKSIDIYNIKNIHIFDDIEKFITPKLIKQHLKSIYNTTLIADLDEYSIKEYLNIEKDLEVVNATKEMDIYGVDLYDKKNNLKIQVKKSNIEIKDHIIGVSEKFIYSKFIKSSKKKYTNFLHIFVNNENTDEFYIIDNKNIQGVVEEMSRSFFVVRRGAENKSNIIKMVGLEKYRDMDKLSNNDFQKNVRKILYID